MFQKLSPNVKVLENGIWTRSIVSIIQFYKNSSLRVIFFIKAQIHQIQYELEPYKSRIRCAFPVEYKMNFPPEINLNSLIQTVFCMCIVHALKTERILEFLFQNRITNFDWNFLNILKWDCVALQRTKHIAFYSIIFPLVKWKYASLIFKVFADFIKSTLEYKTSKINLIRGKNIAFSNSEKWSDKVFIIINKLIPRNHYGIYIFHIRCLNIWLCMWNISLGYTWYAHDIVWSKSQSKFNELGYCCCFHFIFHWPLTNWWRFHKNLLYRINRWCSWKIYDGWISISTFVMSVISAI